MKEQEQEAAYQLADDLRARILKRTGLTARELQCPREKSEGTPCVARDGGLAVAFDRWEGPLCVGCEITLESLEAQENSRAAAK